MSTLKEAQTYEVTDQTLIQLFNDLGELLTQHKQIHIRFPNPQQNTALYEGEVYQLKGQNTRFRSLRTWLEIAEILDTDLAINQLSKQKIEAVLTANSASSWHRTALDSGHEEKYGMQSEYSRIEKLEEPHFLNHLSELSRYVHRLTLKRVLSVGCNRGDELMGIWRGLNLKQQSICQMIGIDHSQSAISEAQSRYPQFKFSVADARSLSTEQYGDLDLLVALNMLHSPAFDGHYLFKTWVKTLLKPNSAVLIGLPNCRYHGQSLRYGAVTKHRGEQQDMSLLLSEAQFYIRYLRQQGFNVSVFGHYTLFIVAVRYKSVVD